jgi:hypothetical protein
MHRFICCLILLLAGCADLLSTETDTLPEIEAFIGARLADSAQDVHYETDGFMDTIIWLRFDLPPDDLAPFLAELGYTDPLEETDLTTSPTPDEAGWWITQPADASASFSEYNLHYQLEVVKSAPDLWTVYLIAFNT